ncbi:MAG TPA: hypothetical protein VL117_10925, partial [Thermoleophilia bacterium]|nr:hypothetical protein [Thermoleophilia bacterium]
SLGCPHCRAEFSFDDWARARSCPSCRRSLSFFEASAAAPPASPGETPPPVAAPEAGLVGVAAPEAGPAGDAWTWSDGSSTAVAAPPLPVAPALPVAPPLPVTAAPIGETAPLAGTAPVDQAAAPAAPLPGASLPVVAPAAIGVTQRRVWAIGDKPLQWSRGWTIVLAIWVAVAAGLVATRVEMGSVAVMTPAERAAVSAVQAVKLPTGATTETVLRYSATHHLTLEGHVAAIPPGGTEMWYAFDRPWEHKTYVYTTLPGTSMMGGNVVLSWTVQDGDASAEAATRAALTKAAQTMAHPPSPNSVPAVPGIIPSIPPGY